MISNVSWSLPNAHVYHQKPLFVPSRRKHVIRLQLIPRVSDACFAATMDWSISHSWQVWWFCPKIFLARCFCAQFELSIINYVCMVVLLYPDISNFKILKCKIFLINFLDESGNFKQTKFYTSKCNFFYILKQQILYIRRLNIPQFSPDSNTVYYSVYLWEKECFWPPLVFQIKRTNNMYIRKKRIVSLLWTDYHLARDGEGFWHLQIVRHSIIKRYMYCTINITTSL